MKKAYMMVEFDEKMGHSATSAIARLNEFGYNATPCDTLNWEKVRDTLKKSRRKADSIHSIADKITELAFDEPIVKPVGKKAFALMKQRIKELESHIEINKGESDALYENIKKLEKEVWDENQSKQSATEREANADNKATELEAKLTTANEDISERNIVITRYKQLLDEARCVVSKLKYLADSQASYDTAKEFLNKDACVSNKPKCEIQKIKSMDQNEYDVLGSKKWDLYVHRKFEEIINYVNKGDLI